MATIAENLQTIKNSTDAIKQAIIDKGGTISGDITTWANAISGISGGGNNADVEINNVYISTISNYISTPGAITISVFCTLEKPLDVTMRAEAVSTDGDMTFSKYIFVYAGATEFEFNSVSVNERSLNDDFSVILSNFYGGRANTKYTFKYNYL